MRSQENYDNVKDDDDEDDDNTGASAFAAAKLGITPPSFSSAESTDTANAATTLSHPKPPTTPLEDPVLVYHDSARSIVFRDHLRRSLRKSENNTTSSLLETIQDDDAETDDMAAAPASSSPQQQQQQAVDVLMLSPTVPKIVPLAPLELGPQDEFLDLLDSQWTTTTNHALDAGDDTSVVSEQPHPVEWTAAERDVCTMLRNQQCTVKTLKNSDWHDFLNRFLVGVPTTSATVNATIRGANTPSQRRFPREHDDIPPATAAEHDTPLFPFNSFVTSTTLLPKDGLRMRCYGSTTQYTTGIVFALPVRHNKKRSNNNNTNNEEEEQDEEVTEDDAVARTQTWSWPAGYSAKTEFNIDSRGFLINGRQEALVPLSELRQYNDDYLYKEEYMVGHRLVKGLSQIPYNEVFLRVGGVGRLVQSPDSVGGSGTPRRSLDRGCGIPVALFVRTATFGHLIALMRTRARVMQALGEAHVKDTPLLLIAPDLGVRVLTEALQLKLWKIAASNLTPFQNSAISFKTTFKHTDEKSFQQKVDELLMFDDTIRATLTPEELARLAGGFGATDDSVATVLQQVMMEDKKLNQQQKDKEPTNNDGESHLLQDVVNQGLAAAVRSGDYHTSRQLLMLYSLVASQGRLLDDTTDQAPKPSDQLNIGIDEGENKPALLTRETSLGRSLELSSKDLALMQKARDGTLSTGLPAPPPPPPLDTDRLRSATNCDGLLAVLGAAQVLKAMQDGGAKKRAHEVVSAVEEWVNHGEQSMTFRIASYFDQLHAQGDLKIATENSSQFLAFVSNKAISNRRAFAHQIRDAVGNTDFNDVRFLLAMDQILKSMNSPCLRLELLQYVLGLDNRYSVAHVFRSVELAASCLSISAIPHAG